MWEDGWVDVDGADVSFGGPWDDPGYPDDVARDGDAPYRSPLRDRNGLRRETYRLALNVYDTARKLRQIGERDLVDQLLRSGTAPGALVAEYRFAESDRDRVHKLGVALKEANECRYWTCLLKDAGVLPTQRALPLLALIDSVIGVLKIFQDKARPKRRRPPAGGPTP